jgi:hypothetical protein
MNSGLEEWLRDRMGDATAEIAVPCDLARRADRHRQRRRVMTRAAAVAITAAVVTATAVVAGTTDTAMTLTARLAGNVESALGTAVAGDDILYAQATDGQDWWYYRGPGKLVSRLEGFQSAGHPLVDQGFAGTSAGGTLTFVDYGARIWFTRTSTGKLPPVSAPQTSCNTDISVRLGQGSATLAANIREALACGQLTSEGTENVNGVNAIKLVSVQTAPGPRRAVLTTTLWVDPATYLPARFEQTRTANGQTISVAQNVTWLPPTSANLARLQVPIPAGFEHVPPPGPTSGQRPSTPSPVSTRP